MQIPEGTPGSSELPGVPSGVPSYNIYTIMVWTLSLIVSKLNHSKDKGKQNYIQVRTR